MPNYDPFYYGGSSKKPSSSPVVLNARNQGYRADKPAPKAKKKPTAPTGGGLGALFGQAAIASIADAVKRTMSGATVEYGDQAGWDAMAEQASGGGYRGGGGGGGGGGIAAILGSIAAAYDLQLQELNRQKDTSGTQIDTARTEAEQKIKAGQAEQDTRSAGINAQIQQQYQAALEQSQAEAKALADEMVKFGVDPSKVAPSVGAQALQQAQLAQQTYAARMGETSADQLNMRLASNEQIAAGAKGVLENNYAAMKARLDLARIQEEAQARAGAGGGGGGGGRGGGGRGGDLFSPQNFDDLLALQKFEYQQAKDQWDMDQRGNLRGKDFLDVYGQYNLDSLVPGTASYAAAASGDPMGYLRSMLDSGRITDDDYDAAMANLAYARSAQARLAARGSNTARRISIAAPSYSSKAAKTVKDTAKKAVKAISFKGR